MIQGLSGSDTKIAWNPTEPSRPLRQTAQVEICLICAGFIYLKMRIAVFKLLIPLIVCLSLTSGAQQAADPKYLFFLHNRFIESHGPLDEHPSYGRAEYQEILARFRKDGFIVLSEKRPDNTDVEIYAGKVKIQIDSLLHAGVRPENITVVGTSKGGYIAQYVSSLSRNQKLNFVFIGSSFKDDMIGVDDITLYGRVLSIAEASDTGRVDLSTQPRFKRSKPETFREILLHTNLHHGFLFKALDAWIVPTEKWALSDSRLQSQP